MGTELHDYLGFDPFAGDKDDGGYKHERRKLVKLRKPTPCDFETSHTAQPGQTAVRYTAVLPGEGWYSFILCTDCIGKWLEEWGE